MKNVNRVIFDITINGKEQTQIMKLDNQDFYFFKQSSDSEREEWIKNYIKERMQIKDVDMIESN